MNNESVSRKTKTLCTRISSIRLILFWYVYLDHDYAEENNSHRAVGSFSFPSSSPAKGSEKLLGTAFTGSEEFQKVWFWWLAVNPALEWKAGCGRTLLARRVIRERWFLEIVVLPPAWAWWLQQGLCSAAVCLVLKLFLKIQHTVKTCVW